MNALPVELRKRLERAIADAREVAEAGARAVLETPAVHLREPYAHMNSEARTLRRRLRAHGRQLGDRLNARSGTRSIYHLVHAIVGTRSIDRLVHECAYEQWHSMLFARFLAENHLLMEPESGVAVTLDECEELEKDEGLDRWGMAARFAHRMLPRVLRPAHPAFEIRFACEHQLKLESLLESLPTEVFFASDALDWSPSGRGAGGEGGGESRKSPIPTDILKHARSLRSKQTDAEQLLWGLLRDRRFAGRKFRRQHPIGRYISVHR